MNYFFVIFTLLSAGMLMPASASERDTVTRFFEILTQTTEPTIYEENEFFGVSSDFRRMILASRDSPYPIPNNVRLLSDSSTPIWSVLREYRDLIVPKDEWDRRLFISSPFTVKWRSGEEHPFIQSGFAILSRSQHSPRFASITFSLPPDGEQTNLIDIDQTRLGSIVGDLIMSIILPSEAFKSTEQGAAVNP